jgi:hypothetical protein
MTDGWRFHAAYERRKVQLDNERDDDDRRP